MIIPLVLDLFLWVGPRLQASALYAQFQPNFTSISAGLDADGKLAVQDMSSIVQDFLTHYNLFSWMSVTLVGVPAVNTTIDASAPLVTGTSPQSLPVADVGTYLGVSAVLTGLGLILGGLFWTMLTVSVRGEPFDLTQWLRNGLSVGRQLIVLTLLALIMVLVAMFPLSFIMALLSAVSLGLASFLPALMITAILWIVFYLAFTVHGLALYHLPLSRALRISALIARVFFASTLGLVTLSLLIYAGLGVIWDQFPPDSWLRIIAMVGNAFIAAGLASASLIYYHNRSTILAERLNLPQLSNF